MRGPARRRVTGEATGVVGAWRALGLRAEVVRSFYLQPIAWVSLLVSAVVLTYGGGAVMFWFHAILRQEAGPAIANPHHWLLDSTLGFLALTPLLGLLLPLAVWHAGGRASQTRARLWVYVVVVATVFTLSTGPGPLLHNALAGAGTPLAGLATRVFGEREEAVLHAMHARPHSPLAEGLLQLVVGLPVYLACTWVSLQVVRAGARIAHRGRRTNPSPPHTAGSLGRP